MKKIDYKGKHFVICDDNCVDDIDFVTGDIRHDELTEEFLRGHVELCMYYGIPPYVGDNEDILEKIQNIEDEYLLSDN